jgi:hypothetical protein
MYPEGTNPFRTNPDGMDPLCGLIHNVDVSRRDLSSNEKSRRNNPQQHHHEFFPVERMSFFAFEKNNGGNVK